ncbi:unnamed protein product [Brachionus calyciflorus]|uniref:Uncharacterized protein n=1 Tax=Brachionus calyciflorus TaxID=104777 RepID=A0A813UPR6_9BILA|nr:unnamed protein product [Brachionus calyciflorus]
MELNLSGNYCIINRNIIDDEELKTISTSKWELDVIFRIEKLKRPTKKLKKGSKSDDSANEENILNELNEIYKILLPKKTRKSEFLTSDSNNQKEDSTSVLKRQRLMLNLSNLCLIYEEVNLCSRIIGYLKENENLSEEFLFEIEFLECEQTIKQLKYKQEKFNKTTVRIRTECINKCHETLRNVLRTQNNRLIQLGCLKQWNFCLPLLQPGLRTNVRRPLQYVAECLETIDSMEWLLRCQIHFELAKCDEEIEQLQTAEQHLLKALHYDDEKIYHEQLEHALKRLRLRAELYSTPEKIEDQVAMILEQCIIGGKSKDKVLKLALSELLETLNKKNDQPKLEINTRSLLLRAGDLLAPNEFTHVLESETFKANFGKLNEDQVTKLYKKVLNYQNCIKKGADHLQDRINEFVRNYKRNNPNSSNDSSELELIIKLDYKERFKLWFDLSKIARKQQIWDICRVSSRFCLLYDSDQFITRFLKSANKFNSLFDVELMRNLAEAHFIFGEALVQYIRGEGIELNDKPKIPENTENSSNKVKRSDQSDTQIEDTKLSVTLRDYENDKEWKEYCDWLASLCKESIDHFLKGIRIGVELKESWLVCQGSAYLWNYLHHIFEKKKNNQILPILTEIFDSIKKIGHDTEAELLVTISVALSTGLMQTWLPQDQIKSLQIPILPDLSQVDKRKQIGAPPSKPITIPPEGISEFKKALEICDYVMNVTNGDDLKDVVSLKDRFPLIKNWVLAKQFCQSPIKNYGLKSNYDKIQDKFTKCMIGVEILNRNLKVQGQNSYEIKEPPSIKELINLIDTAQPWPDKLIELELWSNLSILANKYNQTENLRYCYSKALETLSYFEKRKIENKKIYFKSQYLLSEACIALGEHLAFILNNPNSSPISSNSKHNIDQTTQNSAVSKNSNSKDIRVALRRNALNAFADASLYAANAENYELVVHAARHYWNLCLPYLAQPQERATLYENLNEILSSWNTVYKFKPSDEIVIVEPPVKIEIKKEPEQIVKSSKGTKSAKESEKIKKEETLKNDTKPFFESESQKIDKNEDSLEDAYDDLTLRCVLYACLFQISLDRDQYEEALDQMENALNDLPRTKHRLLIYRFKVITKAKLGLDVQMDLQKFREESEKNLAQMYRKVALSSIKHSDTICSYQRAIETLNSDESIWLKFEYILELAQFMFSNEYNLATCIDLTEWAVDLIMLKIRSDKTSRSESRLTNTGYTSKPQSKGRITNKTTNSRMSLMPTIQDDVEVKSFHKKMDKNSEEEFENLLKTSNGDNLFESSSLEWTQPLKWSDFQDIKQLECLIRSNVILAKMVSQQSNEFTGYLLKAYYSLHRLIVLAIENAMIASREIQKIPQNDPPKKGSQADIKKPIEVKAKKNKNETNSNQFPQNLEQWSTYELSEEIQNSWAHDLMKKTGINQHSLSEPSLLFYYLEQLSEMLNKQGWSHLLFPVYYLQLFVVNSALVLENHSQIVSLNIYVRLKLINLCVELNLIQSIGFHQQALALFILKQGSPETTPMVSAQSLIPNANLLLKLIQIDALEACLSRDQVYSFKQRLTQLEDEESNLKANSMASFSSVKKGGFSSNSYIMTKTKLNKKKILNGKNQNVRISGGSSDLSDKGIDSLQQIDLDDLKLPGDKRKFQNNFHETLYKDIWILLAEYLIENGLFQTARDYLYESLNACVTFDDNKTLAQAEYLLGKIALFDCNFIEAKNYAANVQKIAIDELFWAKSIRLLVDSHRYDYNDKEGYEISIKILQKSIDIVREEKSIRQNKTPILSYIEGIFFNHLAEVTYEGILNGKLNDEDIARNKMSKKSSRRNSMHPSMFKRFSNVCNTYQTSFEIFMQNGHKREAANCLKANSKLLKMFGDDCVNNEAKKDYYLQTLSMLNESLEILNDVLNETLSLHSSNEIQNASLPIQREVVEIKLEICKLLTDILEIHTKEIKNSNEKSSNQDNMSKVIEVYTGSEHKSLNEIEQEWQNTLALIPDLLSVYLVSCHNMSLRVKNLKCQVLYMIGRTYRLISELKYELRKINLNDESNYTASILNISSQISKWNPIIIELIKNYQPSGQSTQDSESSSKSKRRSNTGLPGHTIASPRNVNDLNDSQDETNINILSDRGEYNMNFVDESNLTNIADQDILKNLLVSINQSEAQAIECLLQALNFAFSTEDKENGRKILYELIELIGKFDMNICSQFIAVYQSFATSIEAENIIMKSSLNPKNSLLTGYYNQLKFFSKKNTKENTLNSPIIKQILDLTKSKFNATKFLTINSNHFNYSKEMPSNYIFLVLQHTEKKNELFGAILDNSKGSKSSKQQATNNSWQTKAATIKVKTDPFELNYLIQQWKEWKSNLQSFNLKLEFQLNNDMIKKQSSTTNNQVDSLNDLIKYYLDPSSAKYDEMLQNLNDLENKFEFLINSTEVYLKKVTEFVQNYFSSNMEQQMSAKQNSVAKPNDKLVILADIDLLELPLESLKVFYDNQGLCSISRDFSLQFFATRFFAPREIPEVVKDDKKKEKVSKPNPKQTVVPPPNLEPLPDHANTIDPTSVGYLIDVFNEASTGLPTELTPIGSFKKLSQQFAQICSKWSGLTGNDHSPSLGECETLLKNSSCLMFNGTERFLSYFSSNKIASLNLDTCRLVLANDLVQTSTSFSRLGKDDVLRNSTELECENSLEMNMLLSLTGIRSIMSNQWTTTVVDNTDKFQNIFKDLIENRQPIGEIVRYRIAPHLKFLQQKEKEEEERKSVANSKNENKKDKKDAKPNKSDKKESKAASPKKQQVDLDLESHADDSDYYNNKQFDKEAKRLETLRNLSIMRKENLNMVCYGLPDVYLNIY